MTRVLTNDSLKYATANLNRASHGDNGADHMVFMRFSPAGRLGMEAAAAGPMADAEPAAAVSPDAAIEEGYSSAAGLGLVLVVATVVGAAALGALVLRAVLALIG